MNTSLISVVIPSKNRSKKLQRAIQSVLNQNYQNFEVLVIDDKSEEEIQLVVNSFQDDRILYFLNDKDISNANVCRNIGIDNAQGEYLAMLDSDDEWLPEHLEKRLIFISRNKCDGVFGSYKIYDGVNFKDIVSRDFVGEESMADYILSTGRAATPTHFYRTDLVKKVMWDENLYRHQDYDFSIRFAEKYKFLPSKDLTVIVHWEKGVIRNENFDSQIRFMKKHTLSISPKIFNNYHQNIAKSIYSRKDLPKKIKKYFITRMFCYIHDVTLNEYLGNQLVPKSKLQRFFLRIKFALLTIKG